ncbi:agmatinase family protein [Lysinibacillus piscis]|uniref:Formimidoylglutamase n=1 Tax=Lysinibacillus piscis TaxID=2518931 RepID=A0ABQ5NN41_9BACI|nr:agmatinase family protein [Lysinibacillus sp. KH24]GLC89773.1 formimidoylglutamase [Lysinibacillus sp. KH24]
MFVQSECQWKQEKGSAMNQWIKQKANPEPNDVDVILCGALLSYAQETAKKAQYPTAFRKGWSHFQSYNLDEQIDLRSLAISDIGDVMVHDTDRMLSESAIETAVEHMVTTYPKSFTCLIGGDHAITACSLKGIKNKFPQERIGVIQIDTHLDARNQEAIGLAQDSPIHRLIEKNSIEGKHVYHVGLHGYFNSPEMIYYAREKGIHMITLKQMRRDGIKPTIQEILRQLMHEVDRIYVSVDLDALDIIFAPDVPAATPGGFTAYELFDMLKYIGENEGVRHIDFIYADPKEGELQPKTVKTGITAFLQWLTGIQLDRRNRIRQK